jgi:hypothetical protein
MRKNVPRPFALALLLALIALGFLYVRSGHSFAPLKFTFSTLPLIPVFLFCFLLLLTTGYHFSFFFIKKCDDIERIIASLIVTCLVSYGAFWIYFFSPALGRIFSWLVILSSVGLSVNTYRKNNLGVEGKRALRLFFLGGVFYFSMLNAVQTERSQLHLANDRFIGPLAMDNILPMVFAARMTSPGEYRDLWGNWKSSDRPPLQAAVTLLYYPILYPAYTEGDFYQPLSILLQLIWIPALLFLAKNSQNSATRAEWLTLFCLCSGFFFLNSVFTWPKLLSGGLFLIGLAYLNRWKNQSTSGSLIWGSIAFSLALLSHGGIFFSFPIFVMIFLNSAKTKTISEILKGTALALFVSITLLAPWMAYQHWYAPPGDRLLKMHLAGVEAIDPRSFLTVLKEQYGKVTFWTFLDAKWENLKSVLRLPLTGGWSSNELRQGEFFSLLWTLGALNLLWWKISKLNRVTQIMTYGSLIAVLFWIALMFLPGSSVIHQGSYATPILLFFCLGLCSFELPRLWTTFLWGTHFVYFVVIWIALTPPESPLFIGKGIPNPLMIGIGTYALISLAFHVAYRERLT